MESTTTPQVSDQVANFFEERKDAWKVGREYLEIFGRIPPSFTTPVRTLMLDEAVSEALSPASQFLVLRLLKSPTVKAILYYASLTFHGDKISQSAYLSSSDLMRLYAPSQLAALLGTTFIYRKISKAGKLAKNEKWEILSDGFMEKFEIGGHLGYAIPNIGAMKGMFASSLCQLMIGVFGVHDKDGFEGYLDRLIETEYTFDLEYEHEKWGCTHLDLAGNMLQLLGFGIDIAHAFMIGLGENPPNDPKINKSAYEFKIAAEWVDHLKKYSTAPEREHAGQYYPTQKDFYKLLYEVNRIREQGSPYRWLKRGKQDINPHNTPQLYQEFLMELQQSQQLEEFYQENLPPEILESLTQEELRELADPEKGGIKL